MLHKKRKPSTFTSSSSVDCKYGTAQKIKLHSKSTYFYRWLPISCSLALFLGLGIITNPVVGEVDEASAATTNILTDSNLGTKVDLIMGDTLNTSETVGSGKVAYISNSFSVKVEGRADYHISVQAAEGYGSELTGRINKEKINGVGSKVSPANFSDNTWGYNLGLTSTTADTGAYIPYLPPEALVYSTLPVYGTLTAPTYSAADAKDQTDTYNLTFAAKITDYKPADHYETQALLSVVAEAKEVVKGFGGVTKMSQLTKDVCAKVPTPAVNAAAADIPTGQLIDDREGENGTKYWVAKFADGDCWMAQNMAYSGISNKTGNFNQSKKNTLLVPNDVTNPTSYTETAIPGDYTISEDPNMTKVLDESTSTYNGHYLMGNYYTIDNSQAADACTFAGSGWKLPTSPSAANASAAHGSFSRLLGVYSIDNDSTGSTTLRKAPFCFLYTGNSSSGINNVGGVGYYWSSTPDINNYYYYYLYLDRSRADPQSNNNTYYGYSVRCVVSGE